MIFTTGIFARGDARYYTRIEFPDTILVDSVPTPITDEMIINLYDALSNYSAAKLIAVQKSIAYEIADIPDSNDAEVERRLKVLCKFANGQVKQIEIPAATALPDLTELLSDLQVGLYTSGAIGSPVESILKVDSPPERKARGK